MSDAHGGPDDEDLFEEERIAGHDIPVVATLVRKARAGPMSGSCLIDVYPMVCIIYHHGDTLYMFHPWPRL